MIALTTNETADLYASIDLGWAREVKAAFHAADDGHYHSFFTLDKRVFFLDNYSGSTKAYDVVGEDLELFMSHYGLNA